MMPTDSPALQYSHIGTKKQKERDRIRLQRKLSMMLMNAAGDGHKGAVKRLLRSGAHLLATDKDGRNPLHRAALEGRARNAKLLLGHAKKQGNGTAKKMLLAGTREGRWTALMCAAWRGHSETCGIILEAAHEIGILEALLAARDAHGIDALKRARQSNCTETLRVLLMYEDMASMGPDAANRNI